MKQLDPGLVEKKAFLRFAKYRKLIFFLVAMRGKKKIAWLKKNKVFGFIGNNVLFQPSKLPNHTQQIKIHNNVVIAADVTFYEHDVINSVFSNEDGKNYRSHRTCIEIYDNCFIGGKSIIVGNVSIGPNAIVAAGSVVIRDVKEGEVVGGNPAKVIGSYDDLKHKRFIEDGNKSEPTYQEIWEEFYANKRK